MTRAGGCAVGGRVATVGTLTPRRCARPAGRPDEAVTDLPDDDNRNRLLAQLFGRDVPAGLHGQLLRTADVAALFHVSERTVSDWARRGRIPSVQTPGGHRRYPAAEIRRIMEEADWGDVAPAPRRER